MRKIPIQAVPNQEFSVSIGENRWTLRIKIAVTSMFADVYLNEQVIILGQRIAPGTPVIPYDYLANAGNFILVVENWDLPDWRKFGVTQSLFYVAPGEISDTPDLVVPPIVPFDPAPLMPPSNFAIEYANEV